MSDLYQDPQWWRAQTLQERIHALRNHPLGESSSSDQSVSAAPERIAEWRAQSPFQINEWFAKRLQLAGVSEREFASLLGQSAHSLRGQSPEAPQWLTF